MAILDHWVNYNRFTKYSSKELLLNKKFNEKGDTMELVSKFLDTQLNIKDTTKQVYETELHSFLNEVGKKLNINSTNELEVVKNINGFLVEEIFNKYRNKYKMSTLNKKTTILKDFGKYLVAHNLFEKNPFETLQFYNNKQLQKNTKRKEWLTVNEVREIINKSYDFQRNEFEGSQMRFILGLLTTTGLRAEELLNITFDMIDTVKFNYMINFKSDMTKRDISKRIPLANFTATLYDEYIECRNKINISNDKVKNLVLISSQNKKISTRQLSRMIKRYVNKTNIDKEITTHSFRDTFRTTLTFNNVNENLIRLIGGWSQLDKVSSIYNRDGKEHDDIKIKVCDIL